MTIRELVVFGKTHKYEYDFDIKCDIRIMQKLKEEIGKPQIITFESFTDVMNIYIEEDRWICRECIKWIYEQVKQRINEENIRTCLLSCSIEDKEWTKQRNKGLKGIYYRKVTFLTEIQEAVRKQLDEYINSLNIILEEMAEEEQEKKRELEKRKANWKETHVYKKILPHGEYDGYVDAEYTSKNGETIRMISRDVFDFGIYAFPERLAGTDDIFNKETWTESEKDLRNWLTDFGDFSKNAMRM